MSRNPWNKATRSNPCPKCGGERCLVAPDQQAVFCWRVDDGTGIPKAQGFLYTSAGGEHPPVPEQRRDAPLAPAGDRSRVYGALLDQLALSGPHRTALRERGLTNEEIARRGYRTLEVKGRAALASALIDRFDTDLCSRIPGLYVKKEGDQSWWTLGGSAGIIIPNRTWDGHIVALTVRRDDPGDYGKYSAISSAKHDGPGPGATIHVPLFEGDTSTVSLTEGALKADVSTALSGRLYLALPGVSCLEGVFAILHALKAKVVRLAFDADARRNIHVARALLNTAEKLAANRFEVQLEVWDEADGKGIDDLLASGRAPEVRVGETVRDTILEILQEARQANPGTKQRLTAAEIVRAVELKPDPETAFNLVGDLAKLPTAEYAAVKAQLREIIGGRRLSTRDLDKAVKEQRGRRVSGAEEGALPSVLVNNRPLREKAEEALVLLDQANTPPSLFVRGGSVARVRQDENGVSLIEGVNEPILRGRLTRIANFYVLTEEGERHVTPPDDVVKDILARGQWPFPAIEGVTETPVLRPDGSILDSPGYDDLTRLIYAPAPGLEVPDVPDLPTREQIDAAKRLIWEAIGEFPYANQASAANTIALMLTPIVRPALAGNVPIGLIDAPQAGTGKGLLTEAISVMATGRTAAMMTAPDSDEEWRKKITSVLLTGATVVVVDNVEYPLGSAHLAAVLTAREWSDRRLGSSEQVRLPQRATWIATGNNIRLRGDMPRRSYWIRLDAKQAMPWTREGFTHPNLIEWAREHRGDLLAALLTLARAWFAAGKPAAKVKVLGNFEDWSRTLAGILAHAEVEGFLGNQGELYEQVDEETPEWESFFEAWAANLQFEAYTVADLVRRIKGVEAFREALPSALSRAMDEQGSSFERRLGKALSKRAGVSFPNGYRLEKAGADSAKGHRQWRLTTDEERLESSPVSLFSLFESSLAPCESEDDAPLDTHPTEYTTQGESDSIRAGLNGGNGETGKPPESAGDLSFRDLAKFGNGFTPDPGEGRDDDWENGVSALQGGY